MDGAIGGVFEDELLALRRIVGDKYCRTDAEAVTVTDWRGQTSAPALARVSPADAGQVAAIMRHCDAHRRPVVPAGGMTGLCGGALPLLDHPALLLDLSRLDRIRDIDVENDTITVEAGCILQNVQQAAAERDRLFPLSLGAEGSCNIGGNLSTNAGGVMTIRYGNMRDLVLGLEVVTPQGDLWSGLRGLRKANQGYDLKHLFIGAEGTLGIITAAVLKLYPAPKQRQTAMVAVPDQHAAVALYGYLRRVLGESLFAFEMMAQLGVDLALKYVADLRDPVPGAPYAVLIDCATPSVGDGLRSMLEQALADALEQGLISDAVLAENEDQRAGFWKMRESMAVAPNKEGAKLPFDISVPVSSVAALITRLDAALNEYLPGIRTMPFGHVGDGNIHYTLLPPVGAPIDLLKEDSEALKDIVYGITLDLGGAISAEHGLGTVKRDLWAEIADPTEFAMMRAVKQALDPHGIMNPGKVLPV